MAAFAFDPHDATGLHMLGTTGEFIMESRDGGPTWTQKARTPGFISFQQGVPTKIAWSGTNANVAFLVGPYASLYRASDGGVTWEKILAAERLPQG